MAVNIALMGLIRKRIDSFLSTVKKILNKTMTFKKEIQQGIPNNLPVSIDYDSSINHAPKRKDILSLAEKKLALQNTMQYFYLSLKMN